MFEIRSGENNPVFLARFLPPSHLYGISHIYLGDVILSSQFIIGYRGSTGDREMFWDEGRRGMID